MYPFLRYRTASEQLQRYEEATVMSLAAELERTTRDLAALCRRSFGPCGEETLLFRPPDAPVVTGEGHAVLAAWKRGLGADDPLAKFLLTAANGVHQQLGDGSTEFILLVDAAVRYADESLNRRQDAQYSADRARLSRACGELKWELQREIQTPQSFLAGLQVAVPIELDTTTMQPSIQFREASANILVSALRGMLGERAVDFVAELVLNWAFTSMTHAAGTERTDELLFRRVGQFLKCAPDAVIFVAAPSVYASCVVPLDEFILKKSVVTSQPPEILDRCKGPVRFVCFTCPPLLSAGSNHIELATNSDEELFTAQDAAYLFISKFVRRLRDLFQVQLVVCAEALDESVISICTRQDIACVQLVESEDMEALCMSAGIFSLASAFDDIRPTEHIGVSADGVSRVRFQQQACLRLRGLSKRKNPCGKKRQTEQRRQDIVVPQLLVYAPTKAVYKQYYAAIVKCLRVLKSWWEPMPSQTDYLQRSQQLLYSCRGGGATELVIARWLQGGGEQLSSDVASRDTPMLYLAREILANALIDVVSILQSNLTSGEGPNSNHRVGNQRQVLLDTFSKLNLKDTPDQQQEFQSYTLDYSRVIQTLAGTIQIPELVVGDPAIHGLVHPWRRIDSLLFLVLQTLEQLFRIDKIVARPAAAVS